MTEEDKKLLEIYKIGWNDSADVNDNEADYSGLEAKIISEIPKDKESILKLWEDVELNYDKLKSESIAEKKIEYNNSQRDLRNKIMKFTSYHTISKRKAFIINETWVGYI